MDTKEKERDTSRQRPVREDHHSARRNGDSQGNIQKKAEKPAAGETPRRRRSAEEPRRRREQPDANRQRRSRPVSQSEQTARPRQRREDDRNTRQSAEVKRPQRTETVQFSAPRGTGPRKSAPQMSAQETAVLRQQHRQKKTQVPEKKKNMLQNFISGVRGSDSSSEDAAAKAAQRRKERAAREEKKRKQAERNDTPAVIYTQPAAFSRDRLLLQLFTVTAVVAALVVGMSVFFKVETVTVAGAETYSAWAIREASGITEGDSLLTFSKARASAQIHAELPYVDDVRIGIKLPDTVIIYIEELDVSYAVKSTQGDWWLINSDGRVVEQITANAANNHTQLLGVLLEEPQVGNSAVAANEVPQETLASGEPVPLSVTGEQRLSSALQILKALEANDIVGQAASVDVTDLDYVMLMYGSQYEVLLGDTSRMEYKIACMNDAILQMSDYQAGILDISFEHWTDQVGYTPFG